MATSTLPLMRRQPDSVLALVDDRPVPVARFLAQAHHLAGRLGTGPACLNLCSDRYTFAVAFAAAIIAGKPNLLPANRLHRTVTAMARKYPGMIVIAETPVEGVHARYVDPAPALAESGDCMQIPDIPASRLAAIVHTSGSTGTAASIAKYWYTFHESSLINARELGLDDRPFHGVATVPPQHMWGLETSVLLPWFAPVCMASGQPFYVADICRVLNAMPSPRALVSTPVHLRALIRESRSDDGTLPPLERIYSATAPLHPQDAKCLEERTGAEVIEIYGSSETGCLARRRPARDEAWRLFPEFELQGDGNPYRAVAGHLPGPVTLMDHLELEGPRRFHLAGRHDDLVNIAGKRASLADLTARLLAIPGVVDGVIFQPPERVCGPTPRLAALVVAPDCTVEFIRRNLCGQIDPAFIPRPIRRVETLPRAATGKLPRQALMELFERTVLATP